jgi:hypothetical protein
MANMNSDLQITFNYFAANSLQANASKTNYMIIHPNRNTAGHTPLHINNTNISQVKESTFLGITIDHKLTFQPHIKRITNTISSGLFALCQVKNMLPRPHLKPIYHALIESNLNYGITFWNTATKTHTQRLRVLQKKALSIITHSDYNAPSAHLFAASKTNVPHQQQPPPSRIQHYVPPNQHPVGQSIRHTIPRPNAHPYHKTHIHQRKLYLPGAQPLEFTLKSFTQK